MSKDASRRICSFLIDIDHRPCRLVSEYRRLSNLLKLSFAAVDLPLLELQKEGDNQVLQVFLSYGGQVVFGIRLRPTYIDLLVMDDEIPSLKGGH